MLFLNDADDADFASLDERLALFVPHGHVFAAARSPGREEVDDMFLPVRRAGGNQFRVRHARQFKNRKAFARSDHRPGRRGGSDGGKGEDGSEENTFHGCLDSACEPSLVKLRQAVKFTPEF